MTDVSQCAHGVDREVIQCDLCENEERRVAVARRIGALARMPIHSRPLSHDETPSGITAGDRVEISGAQDGMTFRQHAAALAMQATIVAYQSGPSAQYFGASMSHADVAHDAVLQADALIAELAK